MSPTSYAFNITWLNVIIVKDYLGSFISLQLLFQPFNALSNPYLYILLEGFHKFLADPIMSHYLSS